jgi:dUTP pyrophosphatase
MYTLNICINNKYKDNENLINHYLNRPNYADDAGVDLYQPETIKVKNSGVSFVDLGINCEMIDPNGNFCAFDLRARSSISKSPFMLANSIGTFDKNYRGPVIAALDCLPHRVTTEEVFIQEGTRLVQICAPGLQSIKVNIVDNLSESSRSLSGFGSSGGTH